MPRLKYLTDKGVIGITRVNKDQGYIDIAGAEPAGAPTPGVYFYKNKSKRSPGVQVRYVNLRVPDGPLTPNGQQPYLYARATVLTPTAFAAIVEGDLFTLPGGIYEVYGDGSPEG